MLRLGQGRDRWQALLAAQSEVSDAPDLASMLERACLQAARLVGASGAVVVLLDEDGESAGAAHLGVSTATADRVRHAAAAAAREGRPTSTGLAVPHVDVDLRITGATTGVLTVVGGDRELTDDDLDLTATFAGAITGTLSQALRIDDLSYRGQWYAMLADAARKMASGGADEISSLIERAAVLADAQLVYVVVPTGERDRLVVSHAVGCRADDLVGLSISRSGSLVGSVIESGQTRTEDEPARWIDPTLDGLDQLAAGLVVPFEIDDVGSAALILARDDEHGRFRARDTAMAESLAAYVGVLASQEELRRSQRRLVLLEDRQRIAQDLHDHVVQRLFAVGLGLDMLGAKLADPEAVVRAGDLRAEIKGAIVELRQNILSLNRTSEPSSLSDRVIETVGEVRGFATSPSLAFSGPVDTLVDGALIDDVAAVVREALTNAVRHGRATTAHITVVLSGQRLAVTVVNDGVSFRNPAARSEVSGLANMKRRAQRRGGTLEITQPTAAPGARVRWAVPISSTPGEPANLVHHHN